MLKTLPRLLLAAPSSGSGKTTVTCALLRAFIRRGLRVSSFKCGPDYIDPMFHRQCVGTAESGNLDLFFASENTAKRILSDTNSDLSILEGAMGFYDGIASGTAASAYESAAVTETPVALVLDCRGIAATAAALIKGIQTFRGDANVKAVILNRASAGFYPELKRVIERECGVPVAGYLPFIPDCAIESRHLGLVAAGEIAGLQEKIASLAAQAEKTVDLDLLLTVAKAAPPLGYQPLTPPVSGARIAIARDPAFCFYYAETLSLLRDMGAELLEFSPLKDRELPRGAGALLLGGGYPELYARELGENLSMRRSVRDAVLSGMPTVAECGGFLYLHRELEGADGKSYPMAGVFDHAAFRTPGLGRRFGYVELTAKRDGLLCKKGEKLRGHEFHYWDSRAPGEDFTAKKPQREKSWDCAYMTDTLYAGFPHLYFAQDIPAAVRFTAAAGEYMKKQGAGEDETAGNT